MILEMIRHHSIVDVFFAAKTLRNSKPNMVETMVSKQASFPATYYVVLCRERKMRSAGRQGNEMRLSYYWFHLFNIFLNLFIWKNSVNGKFHIKTLSRCV